MSQSRHIPISVPLVLFLLGLALAVTSASEIVVGKSCSGLGVGSKFTNAENCRTYFVCNASYQFELEFCPSGFYNPLKDACDLDYKCILDNVPGGETTTTKRVVSTQFEEATDTPTTTPLGSSSTSPSTTEEVVSTTPGVFTTTPEEATTEVPTTETEEDLPPSSTVSTTTLVTTTTTSTVVTSTTAVPPGGSTPEVPLDPYSCPLVDTDTPTYLNDKQNCDT